MGAFILNRLREPSTWRGLLTLATVLGVALTPDQAESIALAGAALHLAPATLRAQQTLSETLAWRCEVVYLPARSTWVRSLTLRVEGQRITELRIDAQPVHTFAVEGTLLLTSMDNERIAIDVAAGGWTSDFRGLATGRGRCEREPVSIRP